MAGTILHKTRQGNGATGNSLPVSPLSLNLRLALILCLALILSPFFLHIISHPAYAATWPVSASQPFPTLGFEQTYQAQGKTYTHRGVDVEASAGSSIAAPVCGTVSFVGQVPSGDSSLNGGGPGQTMTAVSIRMDDGRTLTLMPFAEVSVSEGQQIGEGQQVGTLASEGDRSSSQPHLHMGLKANGIYYDPMLLFGAVANGAAAEDSSSVPATSGAAEGSGLLEATQPAYVFSDVQSEALASSGEQANLGTITSGDVAWLPEEDAAPSLAAHVGAAVNGFGEACAFQLGALKQGLKSLAFQTGIPVTLLVVILLAMAIALLGGSIALFARVLLPRAAIAVEKLTKALNVLKGGGNIRELFPAPGTPS